MLNGFEKLNLNRRKNFKCDVSYGIVVSLGWICNQLDQAFHFEREKGTGSTHNAHDIILLVGQGKGLPTAHQSIALLWPAPVIISWNQATNKNFKLKCIEIKAYGYIMTDKIASSGKWL